MGGCGGEMRPRQASSMRQPRLKVPADRPVGYYHCLSRVVDRRFVFGEPEKEHFVKLMREYEAFCEVQVLTHSVMSNHFHILLEVPSGRTYCPMPRRSWPRHSHQWIAASSNKSPVP